MKEILNPFLVSGYQNPELFCDRDEETQRLITNVTNGVHSLLLSIRRMGKTGLIHHTFYKLSKKKRAQCIYLDIYATQNLKDFTGLLGSAVLKAFPEKKGIGKKFVHLLKSLKPVVSFDSLTQLPEIGFDFTRQKECEQTLEDIFEFLGNQNTDIVIAIDEFQQTTFYPEKNTEALLRSLMQTLNNVRFIFSGSLRHLLTEMFTSSKKPFFSSTQSLYLNSISKEKYASFIEEKFSNYNKKINSEAITYILEFSRIHTYYTQVICNRLFSAEYENITLVDVVYECSNLLKENENIFYQYCKLLTPIQWNLLKAIAKEDKLYQPSSKDFIRKHNVGTPANVQRALKSLIGKEMIYQETENQRNYYRVYDCFLARWLLVNR